MDAGSVEISRRRLRPPSERAIVPPPKLTAGNSAPISASGQHRQPPPTDASSPPLAGKQPSLGKSSLALGAGARSKLLEPPAHYAAVSPAARAWLGKQRGSVVSSSNSSEEDAELAAVEKHRGGRGQAEEGVGQASPAPSPTLSALYPKP